jgi:hypothetical protein
LFFLLFFCLPDFALGGFLAVCSAIAMISILFPE